MAKQETTSPVVNKVQETNTQIKDALSVWADMGYGSQQEAMLAAAQLFRVLYNTAHFRGREVCENFIRNPRTFLMSKYMF